MEQVWHRHIPLSHARRRHWHPIALVCDCKDDAFVQMVERKINPFGDAPRWWKGKPTLSGMHPGESQMALVFKWWKSKVTLWGMHPEECTAFTPLSVLKCLRGIARL